MPLIRTIQRIDGKDVEIFVETDLPSASTAGYDYGLQRGAEGVPARIIQGAADSLNKGLDIAKNCALSVAQKMDELGEKARPDEVELKFGVKLDAEVGAVLTKTSAEAHLEITLKWKKTSSKDETQSVR